MTHVTIVAPGILGATPDESTMKAGSFAAAFVERARIVRISPLDNASQAVPICLGLRPEAVGLERGPLMVAALGFDPPERSVCYAIEAMTYDDGSLQRLSLRLAPYEVEALASCSERLNTKRLTFLKGEDRDHALVLEGGSLDMGVRPPQDVDGKSFAASLPEGDDEKDLRRFIDDSINLLSEQEFNARRLGEGLPAINALWPYGCGRRPKVPNLALDYGATGYVQSSSYELHGLTRLAGWRHGERGEFGSGLAVRFEELTERLVDRPLNVLFLESFVELRREGRLEEIDWLTREFVRRLLNPLVERLFDLKGSLTLLAANTDIGLCARADFRVPFENSIPFHETALDDSRIAVVDPWSYVREGFREFSA